MQEVAARGGKIILMTDAKGAAEATIESLVTIVLPDMARDLLRRCSTPSRCSCSPIIPP